MAGGGRRTIWVRVVTIVQSSGTTLQTVVVSVVSLGWLNIIVVMMPRIKRIVHVGGRGWIRVTLMAARRVMTGRYDREGKVKEKKALKCQGWSRLSCKGREHLEAVSKLYTRSSAN
jgi:hypothetical protein